MSPAAQPPVVHGYQLQDRLGEGAYGVVWRATAPGGFPAAMKIISRARNDLIALPEKKALEATRALNHPYLVKVLACWEESEWLIIAMELADGNLRERFDYCREQGATGICAEELLLYLKQASDALDYLHGLGKLHRDIKPENLLVYLGPPPHIKIGDCGLVRDADRLMTMRPQGTPYYMPPESWDARPCAAGDQFALAATYAELRQGFRPFKGQTAYQVEEAIRMHDPDLSGIPPAEAEPLRRALAKSARDRFPTCRDLVEAMEWALVRRADHYRPTERVGLKKEVQAPPPAPAKPQQPDSNWGTNVPQATIPLSPLVQPTLLLPTPADAAAPVPPPPPRSPIRPPWGMIVGTGAVVACLVWVGLLAFLPRPKGKGPSPGPDPTIIDKPPKPDWGQPILLKYPREDVPPSPPMPRPTLPPDFSPASGSRIVGKAPGPLLYSRIVRAVGPERVVFRLVEGPTSFYIMENKVWNALYERFAEERPGRVSAEWKLGGKANGKDTLHVQPRHPVFRVSRLDAERFAAWLGGRLPTADELDRAAGWDTRPDAEDAAVGLRLQGPRPVGTSPGDPGDLCGNGREWTRDSLQDGKLAVLRGQSYTAARALSAADIAAMKKSSDLIPTQFPDRGSPYTSFRVVVDLTAP